MFLRLISEIFYYDTFSEDVIYRLLFFSIVYRFSPNLFLSNESYHFPLFNS